MGFNIGVWSDQTHNNADCYQFVDRMFYNLVNSGEQYGEQSILVQCGKYYGLDLSPFLKLVYTCDEVTHDYVQANIQNVDELLQLVTTFRDRVEQDSSVCDKISYVWYEEPLSMSEHEKECLIKEVGEEMAKPFFDIIEQRLKEGEENPNPWKWYFDEGQIISDLNDLLKRLQCYKDKGITDVYLTAG